MRCAIRTDADAAMRSGDEDVEVAVADGDANLVQVARRCKRGVGAKDGQLTIWTKYDNLSSDKDELGHFIIYVAPRLIDSQAVAYK